MEEGKITHAEEVEDEEMKNRDEQNNRKQD